MILVDTSVLIDFFKGEDNVVVEKLSSAIERKTEIAITPVIYQEILQGARDKKEFDVLDRYLKTQRFVYPKDQVHTYRAAALLFFKSRKNGITIRSTTDCLIAQIAIENHLPLLHNDKDYDEIAKISKLQIY